MALLTIDEYLQVLPNYTFPDIIIRRAMDKYSLTSGDIASDVDERSKDLAEAEIWDSASGLVNSSGMTQKFGNQMIQESSLSTSEETRLMWKRKADTLRAKWGEASGIDLEIYDVTGLWQ